MTEKFEVTVNWLGNYRFEARTGKLSVSIDQRVEEGGEGKGFKPTELLLSAVAGCFSTNLVRILNFRGVEFSKLEVKAYMENRKRIVIEVHSDVDCDTKSLSEVLKAAEETCKISSILKDGCETVVQLRRLKGQ